MAARDITAGRAFIELMVKNGVPLALRAAQRQLQAFAASARAIGSQLTSFGTAITGFGGAMIAPLALATASFVGLGSQLDDISNRTGIAASALAEFKFAAEQSGAGIEDIERASKKMQQTIAQATSGNKAAIASLASIGLTAEALADKLPEEQLQAIADRLAGIEDPAKRTAAAMVVLGKSGPALVPMVNELAALRQQARDLGLVPTDKAVQDAAIIGDLFDQIKSVGLATIFEIGAAFAPVLIPAMEIV